MSEDDLAAKDAEFAARIVDTGNEEKDHKNADAVLIEALRVAGFNKTADAWEDESHYWWWA